MMKKATILVASCLLISVVNADVYLTANQIFCSCGQPENNFYKAYSAAEAGCTGTPAGAGYASCLAIKLGFLSDDCRSLNTDAMMAHLAGHEDFYEGCMVQPFPASVTSGNGTWQWPGSYPYQSMDTALTSFIGCLKSLYIGFCQQSALDYFTCKA